jgi:competence protein ComEC
MLVDGGPNGEVVKCLARYLPFWDRRIEAVVLTHNEADHARGLADVVKRYKVLLFEPKLKKGETLVVGPITMKILWPDEKVLGASTGGEINTRGIVGKLSYGQLDVLLTADVDPANYPETAGIEIVKVPHHGSKFQWNREWWKKVSPGLAVISVGKNSFGHPTPEVIEGLKGLGIKTLRTDQAGDVEIVSDGENWKIVTQ